MTERPFETVPHVTPKYEAFSEDELGHVRERIQTECQDALARIHAILSAGVETQHIASIKEYDHNTRIALTRIREEYELLQTRIMRHGVTLAGTVRSLLGLPKERAEDSSDRGYQAHLWERALQSLLEKEHQTVSLLYAQSGEFDSLRHTIGPHLTRLELLLAQRSE